VQNSYNIFYPASGLPWGNTDLDERLQTVGVVLIFWGLETILKQSNTKSLTILPKTSVYANTDVPEKTLAHMDT